MRGLLLGIITWSLLGMVLLGQQKSDLPLEINSPELTIDHQVGFGEIAFSDAANSAMFRVHNQSSQVLKGRLIVERIHFNRGEIAYRSNLESVEIELGQSSQQSFSFWFSPIRQGSLAVSFQSDKGKTLWQRYVFLQFIESRGARIRLWSVTSETSTLIAGPLGQGPIASNPRRSRITPLDTRPLHKAKIPVWALPRDPRHLAKGNGILLGQDALSRLTMAQEVALGEYVAHGGVLLIPKDRQAFEKSLWQHSPFKITSLESREARFGLGKVLRYPPTALTEGNRDENAWIYKALDENPHRLSPLIAYSASRSMGSRARSSIVTCAWFSGLFLLVTGPVAWMFRSLTRRRFLWLLGSAIGIFCVIAALLGVHLQAKKGELWWTTITEIAPQGGGIQTAVLEMESAGARTHQVQSSNPTSAFHTGTYASQDSGSTSIPLLPWRKSARICDSQVPDCLPITLLFETSDSIELKLSWENPNPFKIEAIQVYLATTDGRPADIFEPRLTASRRNPVDMWNTSLFGANLTQGNHHTVFSMSTNGEFELYDKGLKALWMEDETAIPPKLGAPAHYNIKKLNERSPYSGLVVFQVDRSPGFTLNESKTNFIFGPGLHYVVQQIPEKSLPDYEKLFTKAPYPVPTTTRSNQRRRVRQREL